MTMTSGFDVAFAENLDSLISLLRRNVAEGNDGRSQTFVLASLRALTAPGGDDELNRAYARCAYYALRGNSLKAYRAAEKAVRAERLRSDVDSNA